MLRELDMYVYQNERRERDDGQDEGRTACFSAHKPTATRETFFITPRDSEVAFSRDISILNVESHWAVRSSYLLL